MREIAEIDWARLAAFIDGEGTILLNRFNAQKRSAAQRKRMWLRLIVANTDFRLMVWLYQTFGGNIAAQGKVTNPKHQQAFKWHVSCKGAEEIIRKCLPYFIIKREHAEIALEFQATLGGPGKFVSQEVREKREALRQKLHSLKRITPLFDGSPEQFIPEMKRGPKKLPDPSRSQEHILQ